MRSVHGNTCTVCCSPPPFIVPHSPKVHFCLRRFGQNSSSPNKEVIFNLSLKNILSEFGCGWCANLIKKLFYTFFMQELTCTSDVRHLKRVHILFVVSWSRRSRKILRNICAQNDIPKTNKVSFAELQSTKDSKCTTANSVFLRRKQYHLRLCLAMLSFRCAMLPRM
jgi:hypothetical protein